MKRQQETVGSIVQIHINDEFYVYAHDSIGETVPS